MQGASQSSLLSSGKSSSTKSLSMISCYILSIACGCLAVLWTGSSSGSGSNECVLIKLDVWIL